MFNSKPVNMQKTLENHHLSMENHNLKTMENAELLMFLRGASTAEMHPEMFGAQRGWSISPSLAISYFFFGINSICFFRINQGILLVDPFFFRESYSNIDLKHSALLVVSTG